MIVKMSKLSIVGLKEERSAILRRLMRLGVVQLNELPLTDDEKEKLQGMSLIEDDNTGISELDDQLVQIQNAITFLSEYKQNNLKSVKKELTYEKLVDSKAYSGFWQKVYEANNIQKELTDKKNVLSSLKNELAMLQVWENLQIPVDMTETSTTVLLTGTVASSVNLDNLLNSINEIGYAITEVLGIDKDQSYLCVIIHKSVFDKVSEELKANGFSKTNFGSIKGTIQENIARVNRLIEHTQKQIDVILEESVKYSQNLSDIQSLYDCIFNLRERRREKSKFLNTDKAFIVGGWTPSETAQGIKNDIENNFSVFMEITEPEKDEETPVLLKNNNAVYPFEMITEMYSLPSSKGIDPNAVMAPFYWLFFGLMLSDAGYGILLSVFCAFAIWKYKPERGTLMDKMMKMLFLCGFSTVIWGAAFGSWFGDVSSQIFGTDIKPLWFNPNNDPMRLMVWSFIFGAIHLFSGMALNAYMLIREGKWLDAIFDIGLWYLVLIGIAMLFLGGIFAVTGKYMAIIGAIGLILTQGRNEKNIIKKIVTGILSLYNVTGFLSDVLSYSRLLALGLATGVIAQVINQIGVLTGGFKTIFTSIVLIIVLVGGHLFNMSINTLGAYVHSSRLQYVEFFGKFYESGGSAFSPLKPKMKYLKLK